MQPTLGATIKAATRKGLDCAAKLVTVSYAVQSCRHFVQFWARFPCNSSLGGNGTFEMKAVGWASPMWAVL